MAIVIFVLSIILTVFLGKVFFANTIGTFGAYAKYYFILWVVILFVLIFIANSLGLYTA